MKTLRNYIGGEWVAPSGEYLDLSNPATGEQLGRVPLSGGRDVDHAVAAAQAAFLKWRQVPPVVRARYLFKLKFLMEEQFDDIATTVTREQALAARTTHAIVMPAADMDRAVANISESRFGCAGQRCLAGSVVVAAGKAYEPFRDKLLSTAKDLRLGYGLEPGVNMGPV